MQNVIHPGASRLHGVEIENVHLAKVDLPQNRREIVALAGRKVVDSANLLPAPQELP